MEMKKTYIAPIIEIEEAETQQLLAGSGVIGKMGETSEIGWGGVDEDGSLDPSSNQYDGWDDESWDKL